MRKLLFPALLFVCMITALPLHGQSSGRNDRKTGIVSGAVSNAVTREPLGGVSVVIVGTQLGGATDTAGRFRIAGVPAGTYAVRASSVGFLPAVRSDIVVSPTKPAEVRFELDETELPVGEIDVTAEYFEKTPDEPVSTTTQSYEEIRRLPGGLEDVIRSISILPGVAQALPGRNDLIVRGGAPSENLFIVEDLAVPNINHFGTQGAGGGPLSFINLDFVERTTFSAGGFGARYGDKLSSVLTIGLREGRTDRLGAKATLAATQFGLNLEGPLGRESGSFIFSARRSYLDFVFRSAGFAFVPEYWDFLGKADYALSQTDRLTATVISAIDNVKLFNETDANRFDNSRILYSDQHQVLGTAAWRHLFSKGYSRVAVGQSYISYNYRQHDPQLEAVFRNDSYEHESSVSADLTLQPARNFELSGGVEGKRIRFASDLFLRLFWTNYGVPLQVDVAHTTPAWKGAGYLQGSLILGPVRLTVGGRFDYFNLITRKTALAPRASATYTLTRATTLNFSIGRYYQAPSYIWLVANPENRKLTFLGGNHYIAGVEHLLRSDTKLGIEVYRKSYFDYPASTLQKFLVMANTGAGFGGSAEAYASFGIDPLVSEGYGTAHGIEVLLQKKLSTVPAYGTFSVSFSDSRFTGLDGVSRPRSFDQRWIFNVGGGYILNEKWEFSAKFRYVTGRPYTPFETDGKQLALRYNTTRVGDNHALDIRADRRWYFTAWTLITYIDIQNVYNKKPHDVPRYNDRTKRIEEPGAIGILPSIGVSAEF